MPNASTTLNKRAVAAPVRGGGVDLDVAEAAKGRRGDVDAAHAAQSSCHTDDAGAQLMVERVDGDVDGADVHVEVRVLGNAIDVDDQIATPAPSASTTTATIMKKGGRTR